MSNKIKLERFFYPVGQGLFCRERFTWENGEYNLVYDCGTKNCKGNKNNKYVDTVIEDIFKDVSINLLFISHFHADHINLLKKIKDNVKVIKKIVLPYLTKEELILILADKKVVIDEYTKIILKKAARVNEKSQSNKSNEENNSVEHMDKTQYYVLTRENEEIDNKNDTSLPKPIKSGEEILESFVKNFWRFIPFNYNFTLVKDIFEKIIQEILDTDLETKEDICLTLINKHDLVRSKYEDLVVILKEKYGSIFEKDLNEQSTVLFSVPRLVCIISNQCVQNKCILNRRNSRCSKCKEETIKLCHNCGNENIPLGCIYFGDYKMSSVNLCKDINSKIKEHILYIGTLQIPHHGSLDGVFNKADDYKNKICVISYGIGNTYKHPHPDVVQSILDNEGYPVCVTNGGGYMQTFEFDI